MKPLKNCCPPTITIAMARPRIPFFCCCCFCIYCCCGPPYIFCSFFVVSLPLSYFLLFCIFWGQALPAALPASSLFFCQLLRSQFLFFFASWSMGGGGRGCVRGENFRKRKIMNIYRATIPPVNLAGSCPLRPKCIGKKSTKEERPKIRKSTDTHTHTGKK